MTRRKRGNSWRQMISSFGVQNRNKLQNQSVAQFLVRAQGCDEKDCQKCPGQVLVDFGRHLAASTTPAALSYLTGRCALRAAASHIRRGSNDSAARMVMKTTAQKANAP